MKSFKIQPEKLANIAKSFGFREVAPPNNIGMCQYSNGKVKINVYPTNMTITVDDLHGNITTFKKVEVSTIRNYFEPYITPEKLTIAPTDEQKKWLRIGWDAARKTGRIATERKNGVPIAYGTVAAFETFDDFMDSLR